MSGGSPTAANPTSPDLPSPLCIPVLAPTSHSALAHPVRPGHGLRSTDERTEAQGCWEVGGRGGLPGSPVLWAVTGTGDPFLPPRKAGTLSLPAGLSGLGTGAAVCPVSSPVPWGPAALLCSVCPASHLSSGPVQGPSSVGSRTLPTPSFKFCVNSLNTYIKANREFTVASWRPSLNC